MAKTVSALSQLSFTTLELPKWSRDRDPITDRREKVITKLEEQKSLLADPTFTRTVQKRSGAIQKKVAKWWIVNGGGTATFFVRFGHGQVEFAKGKAGISVPSLESLPTVIDTLITAARAGELDAQMAALSDAIRKKITRKKAA
jgi:hypothetical protein